MHPIQTHRLHIHRYETPASLPEALRSLAEHGPSARIVAGATDLLLELQRGVRPGIDTLIDITRIPDLDHVGLVGDRLEVGAAATHNRVATAPEIVASALPLAQACWEVGSPQLRNRATVVGNLVTGSPANDTISALRALGAELTLASVRGVRTVPLSRFHTGVRQTVLAPDELVTKVSFPPMAPTQRGVFVKLGLRRAQAISVVHGTVVVDFEGDVAKEVRILLGSVAPTIVHAEQAEAYCRGKRLTPAVISETARLAAGEVAPIDDIRATAEYRREAVAVIVARALTALSRGEERAGWPARLVTLGGTRPGGNVYGVPSVRHEDGTPVRAVINGREVEAPHGVSLTLLDWLRDEAGPALGVSLTGTKEGCAEGECGACTVFLDGMAVMSCLVPAARAHGSHIITIEGLAAEGRLHPIQQAFIDQGAVQCGFCIPGFIMAGAKLLEETGRPTPDEIRNGLSGNLCRCTGYYKIMAAVEQAAADLGGGR